MSGLRSLMARASNGKQVAQFIAEYGSATRLQHNQRNARHNLFGQNGHHSFEIFLGFIQQAEIVQRPSAAQVNLRDDHVETRALQALPAPPGSSPDENNC